MGLEPRAIPRAHGLVNFFATSITAQHVVHVPVPLSISTVTRSCGLGRRPAHICSAAALLEDCHQSRDELQRARASPDAATG